MSAGSQWRWPLALGALTLVGLAVALLGEGGLWWALAWLALGVPLAVAARWTWGPRRLRRTR